jgi:uncharacterized membrane protein YphA (DoxX/SURF4 family)
MGWPAQGLLTTGRIVLALAAIGLGARGLVYGDFALQWQPVPEVVPWRTGLACAAAVIAGVLGAGLLWPRLARFAAAWLSAAVLLWVIALHGPRVFAAPLSIAWLGFCEILSIAAGALMLLAATSPNPGFARWGGLVGRLVFGACLPVFGIAHFAYPQFTADFIPAFIPFRLFWAYFTGVAHIAAGLSILSGVLARLGSLLFAVMVSSFVPLVHIPRALGDPSNPEEWTALVIASLISGGAWCAAGSIALSRKR